MARENTYAGVGAIINGSDGVGTDSQEENVEDEVAELHGCRGLVFIFCKEYI